MSEGTKYTPQKKYLKKQKQLRVWISEEKYVLFQQAVAKSGTSIYSVINQFVDEYIQKTCLPLLFCRPKLHLHHQRDLHILGRT